MPKSAFPASEPSLDCLQMPLHAPRVVCLTTATIVFAPLHSLLYSLIPRLEKQSKRQQRSSFCPRLHFPLTIPPCVRTGPTYRPASKAGGSFPPTSSKTLRQRVGSEYRSLSQRHGGPDRGVTWNVRPSMAWKPGLVCRWATTKRGFQRRDSSPKIFRGWG